LVFKRIFGEHPKILRSFLNAVLPLEEGGEIESLEYLPSEQVPVLPLLKRNIVDVRCRDAAGRYFIVEMQMNWTGAFLQRVLFGASQAFVRQLEKGEDYTLLQPVIGLSLLDDIFDRENADTYYHHYRIVNVENPRRIIEGLQLVLIELPKLREEHPQAARRLRWAWLRFLREAGDAGLPGHPTAEQFTAEIGLNEELRDALEISQESAFSPQELAAHERFWDAVRSERTLMNGKLAEGREEGRAEGIEIGVALGMEQALQRLMASGMDEAAARRALGMME
jgi:predicted transposase/invertase (TIGR01784 family)